MICPVCGKFYFGELTVLESKNDLNNNPIQCRKCGWFYDLDQTTNPDLIGLTNELSLNQYKEKYKKILQVNAKYDYFESNHPLPAPHKCPVCCEYTFYDKDTFDICPFCGWEDDGYYKAGGANELSLEDYRNNFNQKRLQNPKYKWINENK